MGSAAVRAPWASCADPHATAASRRRLSLRLHHHPYHHHPVHRRLTTSLPLTCATLAQSRERPTRASACTKRLAPRGAVQRMAWDSGAVSVGKTAAPTTAASIATVGPPLPCDATRCTCSVRSSVPAKPVGTRRRSSAPHTGCACARCKSLPTTRTRRAQADAKRMPGLCGRWMAIVGRRRRLRVRHRLVNHRALRRHHRPRRRPRLRWIAAARPTT